MKFRPVSLFLRSALFPVAVSLISAEELPRPLPDGAWRTLIDEIKPHAGESPWREIAWLTDVSEARRRASAQDKPIVIFTAADGSPLGRT